VKHSKDQNYGGVVARLKLLYDVVQTTCFLGYEPNHDLSVVAENTPFRASKTCQVINLEWKSRCILFIQTILGADKVKEKKPL
jgi:hypothetical protein